MGINYGINRECRLCKIVKEPPSFVGVREICRLCWLDIPAKDRAYYLNEESYLDARIARVKLMKLKRAELLKNLESPLLASENSSPPLPLEVL